MLKNLLFQIALKAFQSQLESGKLGDMLNKLLSNLLFGGKLAITMEGTGTSMKDMLLEMLLGVLREAIQSGKLNDILIKLLGGLLGSKNLTLPVTTSVATDVEIAGDKILITHDDGMVHIIDLA